jgi:hypothetical protein
MATNNSMGLKINLNLDTTQGTKTFNDWSNKVQAQLQNKPLKLNFEIDGQKYEKQIETFIGKNHELVEITTFTNKATKEQFSQVTNLADGFDRLQQAANGQINATHKLSQAQNNLNTHVQKSNSLFKDFVDTFGKMVKFNTINMIYDGIVKSLTECVEITNKFNSAMIEFKKVTDTSNLSMQNYLDTLDKLGQTVGFSRTEMLEAATEFSKGGYDAETAAQLARISSLYRNIADEELSAGDAASYVISQLKAFNMESDNVAETTQNALSIIDKTNEVKLFVTS